MAFAAGVDDGDSVYNYPTDDEEKFRITKSVLYFYDKIPVNKEFSYLIYYNNSLSIRIYPALILEREK